MKLRIIVLAVTLLWTIVQTGCGGTPYTYIPENELKSGPGLFSGEDGELSLISGPQEEKEEDSATSSP